MNQRAQPPHKALAALLLALAFALALTSALLAPCSQAQAAGALPWFAPGQQDNATNSTGSNATDADPADANALNTYRSDESPGDPAGEAQFEVLRQFFQRQLTLAENFPEVFSRRVKEAETLAFTTMCEMQRRRGLLARFRTAQVDLSGLSFTRVTNDPDLARIRVTGSYSFTLGPAARMSVVPKATTGMDPKDLAAAGPKTQGKAVVVQESLDEDALFVLLPEMGQWKIFERRAGWRP